MPQELDRIKHLAGLQQEAPAKKKLKYSSSQYAQALSQLQLRNHKGELHTITPKQQQKIIDIIEQHGFGVELQNYLHKINVINKYAAVSEAPATGDQALANELSSYFAKLAKEMLQNMQRPNTNDVEYEEFVDIAQAFKGGIQAGLDEVNLSGFEFSSNPFGDFGRSINDGPDEELVKILAKYGYRPGPDGDNDEATIVKQQEESSVQPMPVLNAVKETPAMSQVDEAIKKATAQLKSFSNFDGLKPYKPKKK